MRAPTTIRLAGAACLLALLSACSDREANLEQRALLDRGAEERETVFDLFQSDDPNRTVEVNKYIWRASQEVLDFLPLETADPFTGVLSYGYGRPPGGGQAYRATVYVQDPALEARSLNVALATQGGPVNAATAQAVENAILTRARQLRQAEERL
ncbi:protein of unknown function [Palleronia marisminoris]|uniref:DUF3576 domain-containing protein n=1 Tax=Palleronia marisminoris TaxID=315423 RepID=A0A1Y5SMK7_9RHOB|nr:DUF3576 domain-containing protein [Palleronia marisminoris]SFG87309.1 protein of unknown function [Palleronia marisminoris]SLN43062.1 hypothetical protein PAM7066_01878 [Palleronia marisminoris]